jgi:hypothetical protein
MKKIIGICGLIGHGKDTAAGFLIEEGFHRISFAGVLKDACANVFGWDRELLEGSTDESREWRETPDEWWSARLDIPDFTPRLALQQVGTDVLRTHFHPDIWVAACERQVAMAEKDVVISDCRFFNELSAIKRLGGTTTVVWRHDKPVWWSNASTINKANASDKPKHIVDGMTNRYPDVHKSEWSWAGWEFDLELYNTSTLTDFKQQTLDKLIG